ncbi:hypothetical protein EYF80_038601 [Liparis tanakae]|uniref:Uncharacterized protein n=1 Tax=Liparis tanakae TaxID=230148 RepID=A0A4Z2GE63_9TELE|nr:hypothetical protein EYF80_038601 [Liparis tanakae]
MDVVYPDVRANQTEGYLNTSSMTSSAARAINSDTTTTRYPGRSRALALEPHEGHLGAESLVEEITGQAGVENKANRREEED